MIQSNWGRRTAAQEKVWLDKKTNFHYIRRGVDYTPPGTTVRIEVSNPGIQTKDGILKGTATFVLINHDGERRNQHIAWSKDKEDLELFAMEHEWSIVSTD